MARFNHSDQRLMDCARRRHRHLTFNPASVHADTLAVIMSPSKLISSINEAKLTRGCSRHPTAEKFQLENLPLTHWLCLSHTHTHTLLRDLFGGWKWCQKKVRPPGRRQTELRELMFQFETLRVPLCRAARSVTSREKNSSCKLMEGEKKRQIFFVPPELHCPQASSMYDINSSFQMLLFMLFFVFGAKGSSYPNFVVP